MTVSPFSGRQDISPRDSIFSSGKAFFVNVHNHDMQVRNVAFSVVSWNFLLVSIFVEMELGKSCALTLPNR